MKNIFLTVATVLALVGIYSFFPQTTIVKPVGGDFHITNGIPTNSSSTVSTVSTVILATSTSRSYVAISNDSANTVYISFGQAAVLGKGIRISSGTTFIMNSTGILTAGIWGISTASSNVAILESAN